MNSVAADELRERLAATTFAAPQIPVINNVDVAIESDPAKIKDGSFVFGTNDTKGAQQYFDFLAKEDAYTDSHGKTVHTVPVAKNISTDEFLK